MRGGFPISLRSRGVFDDSECSKHTLARSLTISYHPGILIPKFYFHKSQLQLLLNSTIHGHRIRSLGEKEQRTIVIGILGAFGNTKATSSNFPRRRQFSASPILYLRKKISTLISLHVRYQDDLYQPAPLSPRP